MLNGPNSTAASRPNTISVTITPANSDNSATTLIPNIDTPTFNLVLGLNNLDAVQCGVPTRTTPTLTPTTLRSIEQTFEEISQLEPPESHTNQAGFVPPLVNPVSSSTTFISTVDKNSWGGGVATVNSFLPTTIVSKPLQVTSFVPGKAGPVIDTSVGKSSLSDQFDENSSDSSIGSSSGSSLPSRGSGAIYTPILTSSTANIITPALTPSPAILAAQVQCGKRMGGRRPLKEERLSPEEEERRKMRRERNKQAAARCRKRRLDQTNMLQDETEILEDKRSELQSEIQILQQQRDELEFLLATHKPTCRKGHHHHTNTSTIVTSCSSINLPVTTTVPVVTSSSASIVYIKEEPMEEDLEHMEIMKIKNTPPPTSKPTRPTSLAVSSLMMPRHSTVTDLGVSIETPSSGLRELNFESMMEGGTGLTPIASVTPLTTGLTPLNTPVVSLPSTNCGSQQRSSSSDLSSPESAPLKLVSL